MKRLFLKQIKFIKSLNTKKGRKETGKFVVEGFKTIEELVRSEINIEMIIIDKK